MRPLPRRLTILLVLSLLLAVVPVSSVLALEPEPPEVRSAEMDGLPSAEDTVGTLGSDGGVTPVIEAEIPFNMIGFKVPDGVETIAVRTGTNDGTWSDWSELGVNDPELDGPDLGTEEARNENPNATEPLWVGEADQFQVRVHGGDPAGVAATLIDTTGLAEPVTKKLIRHLKPRSEPAEASVGKPTIVTRKEWNGGEDPGYKHEPSYASTVDHVVVHHTAGSNDYSRSEAPAVVRAIHHWHTVGNGWNDIGYNMLIDRYGVVYEGRYGGIDRAVIGAHARGFNTGSFGVSVMGNFEIADIPSAAYSSLAQTLAWKMRLHDMDMSPSRTFWKNNQLVNTISGHRDVGSTACPGKYLYNRLPDLRVRAATAGLPSTGGTPVVGDWNGDGVDTPGIYAKGTFFLRNSNSKGYPDIVVPFGREGDKPLVGDWNGDGKTGIGVARDGTWYLRDHATYGPPTKQFVFGRLSSGDRPIVGDWNRSGTDGVGIVRSGGEWHLRNSLSAGYADQIFVFGRVAGGDFPVVGDWNANGQTTVGIVRGPEWMLSNRNSSGYADRVIRFGRSGDVPIVGDWNGDGKQTIGVVRGRTWYLNDGITNGYAETTFGY